VLTPAQLEAIKQTKVNMTVWLGDYNVATDNRAAYTRQRDAITAALTTYGTDHVGGGGSLLPAVCTHAWLTRLQ
jgi:hypothetical protein